MPGPLSLTTKASASPLVLGAICLLVLVGRWVDLFAMILPSQGDTESIPGLLELGLLCGVAGVAGLTFFWAFGKAPVVPLGESLSCTESSVPV